MPNLSRSTEGARRAFDTLLRNAAARSVMLRIPAPAIAGDTAEQLGLATPQFQDVELTPVVFHNTAAKTITATTSSNATFHPNRPAILPSSGGDGASPNA